MNENYTLFTSFSSHLSADRTIFLDENDEIETTQSQDLISWLEENNIDIDRVKDNKLKINTDLFSFHLFWNDTAFLARCKSSTFSKDIGILNLDLEGSKERFYDCELQSSIISGEEVENQFFANAKTYLQSIEFLKQKSDHAEGDYGFVDYVNTLKQEIVFSTLKEHGRLIVPYGNSVPYFDEGRDISVSTKKLEDAFDPQSKHFPVFIKNQIVGHLYYISPEERSYVLFKDLDEIIKKAEVNFNVYLNDLSIDKIKAEYKAYRDKYFGQLSEVIGKLNSQIIALPITTLGAAFAITRVSDSPLSLAIIIFALLVVTSFTVAMLNEYRSDTQFITSSFDREYETIENSDFFKKYPDELNEFNLVRDKVHAKASFLTRYVNGYYFATVTFNAVLILFALYQISMALKVLIAVMAFFAFLIILGFFLMFQK